MANKVLAGYMWDIYRRCIDILRYGWWVSGQYSQSIGAAPWKTELGLEEVEYVGHLISSTGTSFTSEEASKSLRLPSTGNWENIFVIMSLKRQRWFSPFKSCLTKYKGSKKLNCTEECIEAFHFCRIAVSHCQELYFLGDTATPIL